MYIFLLLLWSYFFLTPRLTGDAVRPLQLFKFLASSWEFCYNSNNNNNDDDDDDDDDDNGSDNESYNKLLKYLPVETSKVYSSFIQISMSVRPMSITVMSMLSVITLRDLITAHAALDILGMEHHATKLKVSYHALNAFETLWGKARGTSIPCNECFFAMSSAQVVLKSVSQKHSGNNYSKSNAFK